MLRKTLITLMCVGLAVATFAKPGIKSIVVFGDSLSDAGNVPIWAQTNLVGDGLPYPEPYYMGRGSNGPVWIEVAAWAYGYEVAPSLDGGTNFAFAGAESGADYSDQNTPNFHTQIGMWQQAVMEETIPPPMPWQLFVVWFGPNDFLRALVEMDPNATPEEQNLFIAAAIQAAVENIAGGIVAIHEAKGRLFLVPNMPPLHMTAWGMSPEAPTAALEMITNNFNAGLEAALEEIEENYDKITILRLNVHDLMVDLIGNPGDYDIADPVYPALLELMAGTPGFDPNTYLSWDGFHPTAYTHSLVAQHALDIIPIGSWWGHAMARGPHGTALLGMGWINDSHWPWVYAYGMDGGQWLWMIEESSRPDGYIALIPNGYKWVFVNYRTGEYYDYEEGAWSVAP